MTKTKATLLLCWCLLITTSTGFQVESTKRISSSTTLFAASRRDFLVGASAAASAAILLSLPSVASASEVSDLVAQIKQARAQLDAVPALIENEKWDSVRAILIQQPLSDCWVKSARPLLPKYAEALGNAEGDELAALEAKEDVISHVRYLDMAVYNNIFNPIGSEGTSGATKELIRSYYEDPTNEWKASVKAFDELIELAN